MSLWGLIQKLPEIEPPKKPPSLKERLKWTFLALVIYYVLGEIQPVGISSTTAKYFQDIQVILASNMGSVISAGIGPIVLASIMLELLHGAGIFHFDFNDSKDRAMFQGLQKLLAYILSFVEAGAYVLTGYLAVSGNVLGLEGAPLAALVVFQVAMGSIILMLLDEVISKYGIGSGISLFIAAGVSKTVIYRTISPTIIPGTEIPVGAIPAAMHYVLTGSITDSFWALLPLLATIAVFLVVVYAEGIRIEIPLSFGRYAGSAGRYPLRFLYVSNIPVILAFALFMNIRLWAGMLASRGIYILGRVGSNGQPIDGLAYYLSPPPGYLTSPSAFATLMNMNEIIRILVFLVALVVSCIIFGKFWVETTNMNAKAVAQQLSGMGVHIPGFRRDPRMVERILEKYIPAITVLGSAFVGLLAWGADIAGAFGTGTGILLTVDILYRFYEQLVSMNIVELYPALKKVVGKK